LSYYVGVQENTPFWRNFSCLHLDFRETPVEAEHAQEPGRRFGIVQAQLLAEYRGDCDGVKSSVSA